MADFKLDMADCKLVSYPIGPKIIESKLGWLTLSYPRHWTDFVGIRSVLS